MMMEITHREMNSSHRGMSSLLQMHDWSHC